VTSLWSNFAVAHSYGPTGEYEFFKIVLLFLSFMSKLKKSRDTTRIKTANRDHKDLAHIGLVANGSTIPLFLVTRAQTCQKAGIEMDMRLLLCQKRGQDHSREP
jgi:hypothetical protein